MNNGIKILFCFAIIASLMFILETPAQAAISGATLRTNLSNTAGVAGSSDRCQISANCTVNITFTESTYTNYTNISFSAGFAIGGVRLQDITNNTGAATSMVRNGQWVNLTYTGKANGILTFNFTVNVTAPSTSGAQSINITTNSTATPTYLYLCARDPAYPFFVSANNSAFDTTCATNTESFGTTTTSMSLNGSGVANFTFWGPNITTQANVTIGYGATNATIVRSNYTSGTNPNNTVWVTTDSSVSNPIITLSNPKDLQTKNFPVAIVGASGGAILALLVLYKIKRRTR